MPNFIPTKPQAFLRGLAWSPLILIALLATTWACGAWYYDGPTPFLAAVHAFVAIGILIRVRPLVRALALVVAGFALTLAWWLTLRPVNEADWQPDVAITAHADIRGDEVTLHNVRNFDYLPGGAPAVPRWETRTVRLSQLTGIDMAINYWGSPWMAHPIVSFQFADAPPVCFSIETRRKVGQDYSAIGGLYRQFALIFIVSDERDVIRVRTNFRKGEDIYLYRSTASVEQTRKRFLEYLASVNQLHDKPRWYNAITTNCTTSIRDQHPSRERMPWDWRILLNGKGDELMYERKTIRTDGLPFAELKQQALINPVAQAAGDALDFSARIRSGRPGFGTQP